jgi:tRNA/tmRNA/rRNA uracil-C5-methylase (TrmA/RlmC/RlmD family)
LSLAKRDVAEGGLKTFEAQVESVAYGGAGVARVDGKVVFIPGTIPGERVLARMTRVRPRFSEAQLVSILEPSADRILPRCPWFGACGGCAYQQIPYALQLEWKTKQVTELFRRVAGIELPPVEHALASPLEWGYRNRIRVHGRGGRVGFFRRGAADVVEVDHCAIASECVNRDLASLRAKWRGEGERTISERPGVRFFEQTNDGAARVLGQVVEGMLPEQGGEWLVDAYCGAGWFSRLLAPSFQRVIGIEINESAVQEARKLAGPRESYWCGGVEICLGEALSELSVSEKGGGTLLLDPPEEGLSGRVRDVVLAMGPGRLIYVSCDPATQARDVRELTRGGYGLRRVVPVDMFPQTSDVEVVALLERSV